MQLTGIELRLLIPTNFRPLLLCGLLSSLLSPAAISAELEDYRNNIKLEFQLHDLKRNIHTLSDYKDKVVLVNFWASWCLPCIQEMPDLKRLSKSLDANNFELLTINISDPARRIEVVLKRLQLEMTVLLDEDGKTFKAWQGELLPTSYLLDKSGQIRYRVIGPTQWNDDDMLSTIKRLISMD